MVPNNNQLVVYIQNSTFVNNVAEVGASIYTHDGGIVGCNLCEFLIDDYHI